jgi:hypothetical protein
LFISVSLLVTEQPTHGRQLLRRELLGKAARKHRIRRVGDNAGEKLHELHPEGTGDIHKHVNLDAMATTLNVYHRRPRDMRGIGQILLIHARIARSTQGGDPLADLPVDFSGL